MESGNSAPFFKRTCNKRCLNKAPVGVSLPFISPFSKQIEFKRPPEAPIFHPTAEEFKDPILYISRIRPLAEQIGMCKIVPPKGTSFPFALDVENFKFATRIQHLNRMDAISRNKFIFLERVKKFWELQGRQFNTPLVQRRVLDLYALQRTVQSEGGFDRVNRDKKWMKIATRMNFVSSKEYIGPLLKEHYAKFVLPYILFVESEKRKRFRKDSKDSSQTKQKKPDEPEIKVPDSKSNVINPVTQTTCDEPKKTRMVSNLENKATEPPSDKSRDDEPHCSKNTKYETQPLPSTSKEETNGAHRSSELQKQDVCSEDKLPKTEFKIPMTEAAFRIERQHSEPKRSNELKRLEFYGAGPKIATFSEPDIDAGGKRKREERKSVNKKECAKCKNSNIDEVSIECHGCNDVYHLSCSVPPLRDFPRGKWHCSPCIFKEMRKSPIEAFGFEDGKKEYRIKEFEQVADKFKMNYFKMPVNKPALKLVEKEFWKIVNQTDHDVRVEYGADINGLDHGTGFPSLKSLKMCSPENYDYHKRYLEHPWNLNNLPVCDGSVFKHIDEPVSGMKIPWMYVGMCFSTFCWHNEDHWSYSINYLHWGQEKTWYSVPGDYAVEFETVMKQNAPELFDAQPDVLHQLVTLMNPNVLMDAGIPVYRLDQNAGQFVITFPRAYHAGFNHGFNFAEAVNFAPPDWIYMGRRCIEYYGLSKRFCVFSQDELLFKIASRYLSVDLQTCAAAYHDFSEIIREEVEYRQYLLEDWSVSTELPFPFDEVPDDERQCDYCKTTVFLSAIFCKCDGQKLVCIKHYDKLCSRCTPEEHYLKVKFSTEEALSIFSGIRQRVAPYELWVNRVRTVLHSANGVQGLGSTRLQQLRDLITQAENNRYPNTKLLQDLVACIKEADSNDEISNNIVSHCGRRRIAGVTDEIKLDEKPTLSFFQDLIKYIQKLNIQLNENEISNFSTTVDEWRSIVKASIESNANSSEEIEIMKREGIGFGLNLPEIEKLEEYIKRLKWREEFNNLLDNPHNLTKEVLLNHSEKGFALDSENDPKIVQAIVKIDRIISKIDAWEEDAEKVIAISTPKPNPEELRNLLEVGEAIHAYLPSKKILEGILEKGEEWVNKVVASNTLKNAPYVDVYEDLLSQANRIHLNLILSKQIEIQLDLVHMWREKVCITFLKNNSLTLMEALAPRNEIGIKSSNKKKRAENLLNKNIIYGVKLSGETDPGVVVAAFKKAEKYEFDIMQQLRLENVRKKIDKEAKFCICRKPAAGFMMECSLCKEKFHGSCLQMGIESNKASTELADTKFLCPVCVRTKRPKLDVLFELVQSMHMIKVRIPEGEALQRLTERAMNWQDRARKLLNTPEMSSALQRLSVPLPNIPRVPSNPEWQSRMSMLRVQQPGNFDRPATMTSGTLGAQTSLPRGAPSSSTSFVPLDHLYSTVSRKSLPPKKHMRKSPLIPRVLEEPARMSEFGFKQLKELMIQGDLMEVFVEETTYIWKLLQTFKQVHYSIWDEGYEDFVKHEAMKAKAAELRELKALKAESASASLKKSFEEKKKIIKKRTGMETQAKKIVKAAKKITKTTNAKIEKTVKVKKAKTDDKQKLTNKKPKRDISGARTTKRRKTSKGANQSDDKTECNDDDNENDDDSCEDDCAAEPCKRPTGSALHWVQCDGGCDLWFHLVCLGITKKEIDLNEDYVCEKCK